MKESNQSVSEEELHAYIDGQLDENRRQEVERYIAEHPQWEQHVQYHQQLNRELSEAYASQLSEPVPERLRRSVKARPLAFWQRPLVAAAAAMLFLTTGMVSGWLLHAEHLDSQATVVALARPAYAAHVVYTPEVLHPVEVNADQEQHLFKWLSNRLGKDVRAPDLSRLGYHLVGGRLLPAEEKPAAQFMYENQSGMRLTLYIRSGFEANRETAFRYREEQGIGTFYWVDGPFGYALSGALTRSELLDLANVLYADLS